MALSTSRVPTGMVWIGQQLVSITGAPILGEGGEGRVLNVDGRAVKYLFTPTYETQRRVEAAIDFFEQPQPIPGVYAPREMVEANGHFVGFTMDLMPSTSQALVRMQYDKSMTLTLTLKLFADLHRIVTQVHQRRGVIGDFNDENVHYVVQAGTPHALLTDTDSVQIPRWNCHLGRPPFVHPRFIGCGMIGTDQVYRESDDWWAYSVHLFKALFKVHPFGGVYTGQPKIRQLIARVQQNIPVWDVNVSAPKKARPYEIVPAKLWDHLVEVLQKRTVDHFPSDLVHLATSSIVECPSCHEEITNLRRNCAYCGSHNSHFREDKDITLALARQILGAEKILETCVYEEGILALIIERGMLKLVKYSQRTETTQEFELFQLDGDGASLPTTYRFRLSSRYMALRDDERWYVFAITPNLGVEAIDIEEIATADNVKPTRSGIYFSNRDGIHFAKIISGMVFSKHVMTAEPTYWWIGPQGHLIATHEGDWIMFHPDLGEPITIDIPEKTGYTPKAIFTPSGNQVLVVLSQKGKSYIYLVRLPSRPIQSDLKPLFYKQVPFYISSGVSFSYNKGIVTLYVPYGGYLRLVLVSESKVKTVKTDVTIPDGYAQYYSSQVYYTSDRMILRATLIER